MIYSESITENAGFRRHQKAPHLISFLKDSRSRHDFRLGSIGNFDSSHALMQAEGATQMLPKSCDKNGCTPNSPNFIPNSEINSFLYASLPPMATVFAFFPSDYVGQYLLVGFGTERKSSSPRRNQNFQSQEFHRMCEVSAQTLRRFHNSSHSCTEAADRAIAMANYEG